MAETVEAAEALFAEGKIEQAQQTLETLLQVYPQDPRILNDLGVVRFVQEDLAQAEGYFLRSLEAHGENLQAMANLADVYRRQGRWPEVIGWVQRQIEQFGESADLVNQLAVAHLEMGQPAQARPLLERSLEMNPDQAPVRESLSMLNQARQAAPAGADAPAQPAGPVARETRAAAPVEDQADGEDPMEWPDLLGSIPLEGQSEPAGADACQGGDPGRLVQRLTDDPFDAEAMAQARSLVANRSIERLKRNDQLGWLALAVAFDDRRWGTGHIDLAGQLLAGLPEPRKHALVHLLLADTSDHVELMLRVLLEGLCEVPTGLAEALDAWIGQVQPTRKLRDQIERTICRGCADVETVRRIGRFEAPAEPLPGDEDDVFLPRRLFKPIEPDEDFCKTLPEPAPDKTGGMRILLLGEIDVNGQLSKLARALNRHTRHVARCVVLQDDGLGHAEDVILRKSNGKMDNARLIEATSLIAEADFFHMARQPMDISGVDWEYHVSENNGLVQYFGEYLRTHAEQARRFHQRTGLLAVTSGDWSLAGLLGDSIGHVPPFLLEPDALPDGPSDYTGPVRICHCPLSGHYRQENHSHVITDVLDRFGGQDGIETEVISGLDNRRCLEARARCHIHFVALGRGLGMGAIESAAMGVVPVLRMTNAWRSLYPDCPLVDVSARNAAETIQALIDDRDRLARTAEACKQWARRVFDARRVAGQYVQLVDLVVNGLNHPADA